MTIYVWSTAAAAVVLLAGGGVGQRDRRFPSESRDSIQQTFRLPAGATRRFELSNVSGDIVVAGAAGDAIEVTGARDIRGVTMDDVDEARRVSTLVSSEDVGGITLQGAGSLRRGCDARGERPRADRWRRFRVHTRYEVRVPAGMALRLCTLNGAIHVSAVSGPVKADGVNGSIAVRHAGGPLVLRTVNGAITAGLRVPPRGEVLLRTVNGGIQLFLPGSAAADVWMKTVNGGLFSDFATSRLEGEPATAEWRGGMRVYHSRSTGVRVSSGGPRIEIETVNGDIRVQRGPEGAQ
ncbi:MAG: DUF4097 domain-containing protein [Vicinamibacterales bacterium]